MIFPKLKNTVTGYKIEVCMEEEYAKGRQMWINEGWLLLFQRKSQGTDTSDSTGVEAEGAARGLQEDERVRQVNSVRTGITV